MISLPRTVGCYAGRDATTSSGQWCVGRLPRSMVIKGDTRKGIKTSKERITVLLACSTAGEKLTPLVIGKAANPRCFRGVDKCLLPVMYRVNMKAWMTSVLFTEWMERLNS